jgi:hypothetical protein
MCRGKHDTDDDIAADVGIGLEFLVQTAAVQYGIDDFRTLSR